MESKDNEIHNLKTKHKWPQYEFNDLLKDDDGRDKLSLENKKLRDIHSNNHLIQKKLE